MKIEKENIKKVLVIKFGGIGDVLLSTPVLPNLKKYFPDAEIHFLTHSSCREIFIDNPYITRYYTYNFGEPDSKRLLKSMREKEFDLIIDLYGNPRSASITFFSKAKYRVGYNFRNRKYAYNIIVEAKNNNEHNVEFNLDSLREMEIPIESKELSFYINDSHKHFADDFINSNNIGKKDIFGIVISGGWETKKYKAKDYTELIKKIKEKFDVNFLLIWGVEKERKECEEIKNGTGDYVFISPQTALKYSYALMEKCKLLIGNDSGLLHLSVASGVPVLGIYGPTNPVSQGPFGEKNLYVRHEKLDCLNCNLLECKIGNICMTELPKELIVKKIEILNNREKIMG
ncbi:MAG: glycosyltransferase family 9 protein [Ignavibacteriae bacterium]|nr:glycosyltransferase family 9 protein [Ignavibacteriota bacterium]